MGEAYHAKRQSSWDKLKQAEYKLDLIELLQHDYIIPSEEKDNRENEKDLNVNNIEDTVYIISEIQKLGLKFWDGFKFYIENNSLNEFDWAQCMDIINRIRNKKNLTNRDLSYGKRVLDLIYENPKLIDEIKSLSKLDETVSIEVKFIYDRLLLISKDDWKRIIDLATQTNIFEYLELSNVKQVNNAILRKESVKEQSLIKCYESIQKLKKFGIYV